MSANTASGNTPRPFTPEELSHFQNEDKHAGGAVVCLMAAIFTIGLILYSIIAFVAFQKPG